MDYGQLLSLSVDLGYGLLESGAEIYRVEESILRLLHAYGVGQVEPFVIPNCIIISLVTSEGEPLTQVRRMPSHGTDLDQLERLNDLCRRLCREVPPLEEARRQLQGVYAARRAYSLPMVLLAYFVGAAAFSLFFGGSWRDGLCAGLCGLIIGLTVSGLTLLRTNLFLKTMLGSALSAFVALGLTHLGLGEHSERVIIGAFMSMVPGFLFTNSIRDMMAGDMVAGLSRLADALLTAVALALGAAVALGLTRLLWGV